MNLLEKINDLLDKLIIFEDSFVFEIKEKLGEMSEAEIAELAVILEKANSFQDDFLKKNPEIIHDLEAGIHSEVKKAVVKKFEAADAAALQKILQKIQNL